MPTVAEPKSQIKVADEVFIASALLHREQPEREDFTIREIVERAAKENLYGDLRPGVHVHASLHCVANKAPNPGRYRMLYATGTHTRRLLRASDDVHQDRSGKIWPDPTDIPGRYHELIEWAKQRYDQDGSGHFPKWLGKMHELTGNRTPYLAGGGRGRICSQTPGGLGLSRIFFDTNLFIYLLEDEAVRGRRVADILDKMPERHDELVTSTLTLGEILVKPLALGDAEWAKRYEVVFSSPGVFLVSFDTASARIYARLRQDKTLKPPDAIQLACAGAARCDLFITNDDRLSRKVVPELQFITSLDRCPL